MMKDLTGCYAYRRPCDPDKGATSRWSRDAHVDHDPCSSVVVLLSNPTRTGPRVSPASVTPEVFS